MNLRLLLLTAYVSLLISCKEKGPLIDFGTGIKTTDTTYIAVTETPQLRNILIEDFTGVSCPPCPLGHATLKAILAKYPGRIVITGNHIFGFTQARPIPDVSRQDFRTQDATDIAAAFGGVSFMPAAIVDRIPDITGTYVQSRASWISNVDARISVAAPLNINVTTNWDEQQRKVQARIKLSYTQSISKKHSLTIAVIENEIIDAQETSTHIDTFYTHNDVLRDIVTLTSGVPVLDTIQVKQAGRVFERTISIDLNPAWKRENCKIVAFVHYMEDTDKSVVQAIEVEIK